MLAAGVGRVPALRRRRTFCMLAGVRCISHQIRYWVFCFCGNCSSMRVLRYEVLCCSIFLWIRSDNHCILLLVGKGGIPAGVLRLCMPVPGMWCLNLRRRWSFLRSQYPEPPCCPIVLIRYGLHFPDFVSSYHIRCSQCVSCCMERGTRMSHMYQ